MRNAFAAEITSLASERKNITLLSGDIGNRLFDSYKEKCADRFFNCGVAEANMIGVAAGMALSGLRPVVYTINSFLVNRAYEQIRLDVCYHNVPVVLVGVGGGLGYASLGPTHHSLEDLAVLRVLPNMTVLCPADPVETRVALRAALNHSGPVYIRLGKKGEEVIHKTPPAFSIGEGITIKKGSDVVFLSTGTVLPMAIEAAAELEKNKISVGVISTPTVKPLNPSLLKDVFSEFRIVVTVEEHSRIGGFGASVAEWAIDNAPLKAQLVRFGTADKFLHEASTLDYAREHLGLSKDKIVQEILEKFRRLP